MDDQLTLDNARRAIRRFVREGETERRSRANDVVQQGLRHGRFLTIDQRFAEWIKTRDGQVVYLELVDRAQRLWRAGWRHYSHKAIIETIRYDQNVSVGPDAGFKINDHYSSRLARKVMADCPNLDGFFEIRELRS